MTARRVAVLVLASILLLADGAWSAHGGGPDTQENVVLENANAKIGFLVYPPGATSGIHINPEPEIGMVVEGELTLVTRTGKQVYKAGSAFFLDTGSGHIALNETKAPLKFWAVNMKKCE